MFRDTACCSDGIKQGFSCSHGDLVEELLTSLLFTPVKNTVDLDLKVSGSTFVRDLLNLDVRELGLDDQNGSIIMLPKASASTVLNGHGA